MAMNPDIRSYAYPFFLEEAPELLRTIETGILKLRQARDTATIYNIMRAAHSLKGGAASVDLTAIQSIAHRLETIFRALYSESLVVDAELEYQLLQAFDCLQEPLTDQLTQGYFEPEQALAAAEPILLQLEARCQEAIAETQNFIPSSSEVGVNMAASIFEIDVAQGLEILSTVLEAPQAYDVARELQAQAEIFAGFAELLNLSGFAKIAQTALQALEVHPDRSLEITALALVDFHAGREAVLAGDLTEGGNPSAALLNLAGFSESVAAVVDDIAYDAAYTDGTDNGYTDSFADAFADAFESGDLATNLTIDVAASPAIQSEFTGADEALDLTSEEMKALLEQLGRDPEDLSLLLELNQTNGQLLTEVEVNILDEVDFETWIDPAAPNSLSAELPPEQMSLQLEDVFGGLELPPDVELSAFSNVMLPESEPISGSSHLFGDRSLDDPRSAPSKINIKPKSSRTKLAKAANSIVRVDAERLAHMSNLLSELTINRNGLALQNDQLRSVIRGLLNRFERFQETVEQIRSLSDQLLIAPEERNVGLNPANGTNVINRSLNINSPFLNQLFEQAPVSSQNSALVAPPDFDALEMDQYTALHTYTQTLLEETMQLEETVGDISLLNRQSEQLLEQHRKMLSQMQDDLIWTRMLPLDEVFNRFPRVLRDLSNTHKKPVNFSISGSELLVDKAVLEKLYDPLLHLLRNGFDHGIESPEVRRAQGKPEAGQMAIQAAYKGRQVVVEVRDDGRGLDLHRIRQRVVEVGWLTAAEAARVPDNEICEFIFEPGFSTAAQVSELSGRGIGLDAVRSQLQLLKGTIAVQSTTGQGTSFILTLPLTLTIVNLLVCYVGSMPIALRSSSITEIVIPKLDQIQQVKTQRFVQWQDQQVPAYRLSDLLTYACVIPEMPSSRILGIVPSPADWETPMLIFKRDQQAFALQVDRLVTEQESVIKPFGSAIAAPPYTYGCTVLSDGSLIPVIDGVAFLETLMSRGIANQLTPEESLAAPAPESKPALDALDALESSNFNESGLTSIVPSPEIRLETVLEAGAIAPAPPSIRITQTSTVLVVDDAITSRRMLAASLERAGYRVLQARDGQEALEQLSQTQRQSVRLIICDIEMPNMNGFEFLTQRRQNPAIAAIPAVMLSSRSNDKHRWLAMQLGATAYFTKPYLEQQFLGAIAQHIQQA